MIPAITGAFFGSIPSPSSGSLHLGPLRLNAYGLMIALGVIAGVWMMGRRFEQAKIGTRDNASQIAVWAVAAGVIGARLYHVVTSWQVGGFPGHPWKIFAIWEGGLGIPGGLLAGILVGVWRIRKLNIPVAKALSAAAPGLPLSQAIGRWGNWWNQELFGRPTRLPWALRIDTAHLPAGYLPGTTFQPTFLYESLGNFLICGLLLLIGRRFRLRPGRLLAIYLAMYSFLRFFVEGLRIDDAHTGGGLRLNQWVALGAFIVAVGYLVADKFRPHPALIDAVTDGDQATTTDDMDIVPGEHDVDAPEHDSDALEHDTDTDAPEEAQLDEHDLPLATDVSHGPPGENAEAG